MRRREARRLTHQLDVVAIPDETTKRKTNLRANKKKKARRTSRAAGRDGDTSPRGGDARRFITRKLIETLVYPVTGTSTDQVRLRKFADTDLRQ